MHVHGVLLGPDGKELFSQSNPGQVTLTGSFVGYSTDTKPSTGVNKGDDFLEIDTGNVYIYDGTQWVMVA